VHSPIEGWIKEVRYIPGLLWPVNDWSVTSIEDLFVKNERVVVEIESARGVMAVVFVGATNVGSIRLAFEPELKTNHMHVRSPQKWNYPTKSLPISKGQELGMFCMGSTVIVVAPPTWSELSQITQNQAPTMVKVRSF
jgi:phosphatidylserine decarboxylase